MSDANGVDEITRFRKGKIMTAFEAIWRRLGYTSYASDPAVKNCTIHTMEAMKVKVKKAVKAMHGNNRRKEDNKPPTTSPWEKYLFRPASLDTEAGRPLTLLDFSENYETSSTRPVLLGSHPEDVLKHGTQLPAQPRAMKDQRLCHVSNVLGSIVYYYRRRTPCVFRVTRTAFGTETWYLRVLAMNISVEPGTFAGRATSDPLKKLLINPDTNETLTTFQEAARARGLVRNLEEGEQAIREAYEDGSTPEALITLFVTCALAGYPMARILTDVVFDDIRVHLCRRFNHHTDAARYQALLQRLKVEFLRNDSDLLRHGLPEPDDEDEDCELQAEKQHWQHRMQDLEDLLTTVHCRSDYQDEGGGGEAYPPLNRDPTHIYLDEEQTRLIDECMADLNPPPGTPRQMKIRFMDGPAGSGKTVTGNCLFAKVRLRGGVCLASASTALAARLYPRGLTLHSLGGINVVKRANERIESRVKAGSSRAQLLHEASIILIDEISSLHRANLEVFVELLKSVGFKGTLILAGDFRQIAPVVRRGSRQDTVDASPVRSFLWANVQRHTLVNNHRAAEDPAWCDNTMRIAHMQECPAKLGPAKSAVNNRYIEDGYYWDLNGLVPQQQRYDPSSRKQAIKKIFGDNLMDCDGAAILAATNAQVQEWNDEISEMRAGDAGKRTYLAHNFIGNREAERSDASDPFASEIEDSEFLATTGDNGVPQHQLTLRVGDICFVLRTINKSAGLVTNARVRILSLGVHRIKVCIIGSAAENNGVDITADIPRIRFTYRLGTGDLEITRKQFPLALGYAITINKAQGQTLRRVLLDLTTQPFTHGHLYVACSRTRNSASFFAYMHNRTMPLHACNVVYKDLLQTNDYSDLNHDLSELEEDGYESDPGFVAL